MAQISRAARTILLVVALIGFLSCPLLFAAGMFAPRAIGFLDTVVCPPDMQLNNSVSAQADLRGNVTSVTLVCTGGGREPVDATGRMLLILFGLPVLGIIVLTIRSVIPVNQRQATPSDSAT